MDMVGTQELPGVVRLNGLVPREHQRGPSFSSQEFISKGHLLGDFSVLYDSLIEEQLCGSDGNVLLRSPAMRMSLMDGGPSYCTQSPSQHSCPRPPFPRTALRQFLSMKGKK